MLIFDDLGCQKLCEVCTLTTLTLRSCLTCRRLQRSARMTNQAQWKQLISHQTQSAASQMQAQEAAASSSHLPWLLRLAWQMLTRMESFLMMVGLLMLLRKKVWCCSAHAIFIFLISAHVHCALASGYHFA